ncbi:putative pyridoxal kinase Bud17p [Monosporozyma unispora]|nr:bud site selection protein [Kazachstania unispora]
MTRGDTRTNAIKKALLIQSHVVHGYVGNKAATFPLQYRGWDIDALNSVQYSNHPGYGFFSGFQSSNKELTSVLSKGLIDAMKINYDVILTGYLPKGDMLREMGKLVGELVQNHHETKWILDPVLGDNGKLYVEQSTVQVVKDLLSDPNNRISLTTPNQFEMELLTDMKITSLECLKKSFHEFHKLYPTIRRVVVTSIILPNHQGEYISAFWDMTNPNTHPYYYVVPRIPAQFFGSGDLFTALLMDSMQEYNHMIEAVGKSLWLVIQVLKRTYDAQLKPNPTVIRDLQLIQCKDLWGKEWDEIPAVSPLEPLLFEN